MIKHTLNKRLLVLSAAVTMLLSQSAFAGETVELNLDEAMQRAFDTNPAISIAGYGRDSARAAYNAARQSRGIAITATHQSQRSGLDDEMPVISKVTGIPTGEFSKNIHNNHTNAVTATLPIYTGGKLSGMIKQAKAGYLFAEEGVQKAYNDMRSTVTNSYFNMLQADNMQKLSEESVTRLTDHLKNVKAQYDVGVVAKADVLRSEVELANAKQNLIQAENAYQIAEANLNKVCLLYTSDAADE